MELSILLFGSMSRQDFDANSDIDLCVIHNTNNSNEDIELYVKDEYPLEEYEITIINRNLFEHMLEKGSLFLWHIKLEGKILRDDSNYYKDSIIELKSFDDLESEIQYHKEIFDDLKESYLQIDKVTSFDFSLLFTIVRNICIVLCYIKGNPKFGRIDAFNYCIKELKDFPISKNQYLNLSNHKLKYVRNTKVEESNQNLESYLDLVTKLFHYVEREITVQYE